MRKLFFIFSLVFFANFASASDFTKASVLTGSPGRIVSTEALKGCEAGCRIVLTNTNGPMRTEFRTVKTNKLVGTYRFTASRHPDRGLYTGLPASRVPTVSYAARPRGVKINGKLVRRYTNADIPHRNCYSLTSAEKLKPSGKVYTNADLYRNKQ